MIIIHGQITTAYQDVRRISSFQLPRAELQRQRPALTASFGMSSRRCGKGLFETEESSAVLAQTMPTETGLNREAKWRPLKNMNQSAQDCLSIFQSKPYEASKLIVDKMLCQFPCWNARSFYRIPRLLWIFYFQYFPELHLEVHKLKRSSVGVRIGQNLKHADIYTKRKQICTGNV